MMTFKIFTLRLLLAAPFLAGLGGCLSQSDEAECSQEAVGSVTQVTGPRTGTVGTPVPVSYTVSIPSSCGKFKELREQKDGNKTFLVPTVRYEGCVCAQTGADYQGTYQFVATQPGTYVLLFPNATKALTDTITIQ
ncbi:hypothetical protein [Hymenobacter sp. UYP22]|uniref:hypothetical protein n=1 Tax=Hymenobacter sp. UYP22 TaxID=3156348 RepID=UPI003399A915